MTGQQLENSEREMTDLSATMQTAKLLRGGELDESSRVVVLMEGDGAQQLIVLGKQLADALALPWDAIVPETPSNVDKRNLAQIGDALASASSLGAAVYRIPAVSAVDALERHLENVGRAHVVLCAGPRGLLARLLRPSLIEEIARRSPGVVVHAVLGLANKSGLIGTQAPARLRSYLIAVATSIATLGLALALKALTGTSFFSILFLFPVIGTAMTGGMRPALLAAMISSASFNVLFLTPTRTFDPWAAQTWLMFVVLSAVGVYTSLITTTLRGRLALSDRSARESAALAAFAQTLARVADWPSTAEAVCHEVHSALGVRTVLAREVGGELRTVASDPSGAQLEPLDKTALDWAWRHGQPAGSGTGMLAAANWQFQPLMTSLGVLAVLGMAREDGRSPVPPEKEVLLGTIVAQAALAHERLLLEDQQRQPEQELVRYDVLPI